MSIEGQRDAIRDEITLVLRGRAEVLFALLFGSRVAGRRPRPGSDWDLGVFLEPTLTPKERFALRLRLIARLEAVAPADVTVLNDASPLLGHRALQGELLFARDRVAYVRYFVKTIAMAEDERHYREVHRRALAERLQEGTFGRP